MDIRSFIDTHYRHFNARVLREAARCYEQHLESGGKMLLAMAGAMSTAELGLSLAEMIRQDKIHAISCTGANLEEDLYNLVAHDYYRVVPEYRDLTQQQEKELFEQGLNRVTDTCIPEEEAMKRLQPPWLEIVKQAEADGERLFPHEVFFRLLRSGVLDDQYQIDPRHSWMVAAAEKNLPMVVPGWEDSTLGNFFAARIHDQTLQPTTIKSGSEYMSWFLGWYRETAPVSSLGIFQIGGGIAGDFPICAVPCLQVDLSEKDTPFWGYFCQISDSTTSYGSYSGAVPNEKITWGKLEPGTPSFVIESDATIVAPLMFAYLLGY